MEKTKVFIALFAGLFILLGFLAWRLEFNPPFFSFWVYLIIGFALVAALTWGRLIGRGLVIISICSLGLFLILLLFFKDAKWSEIKIFLFVGIICLVLGGILNSIGSREVEQFHDERDAHANRDIVCAKCSQYLGKASGFESPCPLCGSNRYTYED